jgi:hypothetical protein
MGLLNADGQEMNGNGRLRTWLPVVIWTASTLVIVSLAWGSMSARMDVLEVKYDRLYQDIAEIKSDVKAILRETGR